MTYKNLKTNLERELLMVLILGLRHHNISNERAKDVARNLLGVLKTKNSSEEVLESLAKICQTFPELIDPYIKVAKKYEEEDVKERISRVLVSLEYDVDIKMEVN